MVFALSGDPKGLHFGGIFVYIWGSILCPFGIPCFGAGQPAEIPDAPKEDSQKEIVKPNNLFE